MLLSTLYSALHDDCMCVEYAYSNLLVHSNYLLSLLCQRQIIKKNIQENDASFSHYKILELD